MSINPPNKPPRLEREFHELINSVVTSSSDSQETDWIEWKLGEINLNSKRGHFSIARQILAFSNRSPERARGKASGYAYVLVGVEPGKITPVDTLDSAKIDAGLTRYLGTSVAPRWRPHELGVDGGVVYVFEIEPPESGDPIFTLEREFSWDESPGQGDKPIKKHAAQGSVFIRRHGRVEYANSEDIRALSKRLVVRTEASADADLEYLDRRPLGVLDWNTNEVDHAIQQISRDLNSKADKALAPEPKPTGIYSGLSPSSLLQASAQTIANRREEFSEDVTEYEGELREYAREAAVGTLARNNLARVTLALRNTSDVTLEEAIFSVATTSELIQFAALSKAGDFGRAPYPPPIPSKSSLGSVITPRLLTLDGPNSQLRTKRDVEVNGFEFLFQQNIGNLHADAGVRLEEFHLIARVDAVGAVVKLPWRVTSKNQTPLTGVIEVEFSAKTLDGAKAFIDAWAESD